MASDDLNIVVRTPGQFVEALRRFRRRLKLSQQEVGDKVGIPQTTVSKVEKQLINPTLTMVFKVVSALDLEVVVRPRSRATRRDR